MDCKSQIPLIRLLRRHLLPPEEKECAQRDADFETISASPLEDRSDEKIRTEQVCPTA